MVMVVDIQNKLELDFGPKLVFAKDELEALYITTNWLVSDRVVRSVIYLANGDIDLLKENIERALTDYKDLLWQAEYNRGDEQLRDFNKTFQELGLVKSKNEDQAGGSLNSN